MQHPRPHGTFCWADLGTTDAAGAIAFYGALFGWTRTEPDVGGASPYWMLQKDGADFGGLFELGGPMFEGVPPHWTFYVSVADVDAMAAKVTALGGTVTMPPMDIPGIGRMATIQDPTGARLSLYQPGDHPGSCADPMAMDNFGWVELNTRDTAAARRFYSALFGWEAKVDSGPVPYTEWRLPGGQPFGGMMEIKNDWGDAPPCWLGYVMVADCEATFANASGLGAAPVVPPMYIENVGQFAVVADPQGAVFAFIALDPHHPQ